MKWKSSKLIDIARLGEASHDDGCWCFRAVVGKEFSNSVDGETLVHNDTFTILFTSRSRSYFCESSYLGISFLIFSIGVVPSLLTSPPTWARVSCKLLRVKSHLQLQTSVT
jgi:hypothetical protein